MNSHRPLHRTRGSLWFAGLIALGASLLWTPQRLQALTMQVVDATGTPRKFSAHSPQKLCFFVALSSFNTTAAAQVTFEGPGGDLATRPAIAGGDDPVCFEAPAVADAGRWRGCEPPRDVIPEAYLISAKYDAVGAPEEEAAQVGEVEPSSFVWKVERIISEKDPRPEECEALDGDWTWTFATGTLDCARLPMKLELPGFSDSVTVATDGDGLEGLRMDVTGSQKSERIVLVRQSNVRRGGLELAAWEGLQDISGMLDQGGEIPGKYSLVVKSDRRLEGSLTVDKVRIQEDVCSISWPFQVTR
ncbi:MAG: hypothetical protein AAF725_16285 [Acidobacteriota bacterium]